MCWKVGSRLEQSNKLSWDVISRNFWANPMESSGTGIALNFSQPGARRSGLYTHIAINHWVRAICGKGHDLGRGSIIKSGQSPKMTNS